MIHIKHARERKEIHKSLDNFNKYAPDHIDIDNLRTRLSQTKYWVYDPASGTFAPNKFAGCRDITFDTYLKLRRKNNTGDSSGGQNIREVIEDILNGDYDEDSALTEQLKAWGRDLYGFPVFENVDTSKWKFLKL